MGKLKIYIDENVDISIAKGLKKQGIEVLTAIDEGLIGKSDIEHFNYARKINAVLFTHDHHFLNIAKRANEKGLNHPGVIFSKMNKYGIGECIRRLSVYAEIITPEEMKNQIEFL
ncbi:MAG: DUF5615 family PIN-like protein [Proteobacteria bacterium]|nr:DUF5615 family PIN-like protein [Pseudomonadota bacterium]